MRWLIPVVFLGLVAWGGRYSYAHPLTTPASTAILLCLPALLVLATLRKTRGPGGCTLLLVLPALFWCHLQYAHGLQNLGDTVDKAAVVREATELWSHSRFGVLHRQPDGSYAGDGSTVPATAEIARLGAESLHVQPPGVAIRLPLGGPDFTGYVIPLGTTKETKPPWGSQQTPLGDGLFRVAD